MGFDDTFYYFGNERQVRDWPVVGEFLFIQSGFLKLWRWRIHWEWDETGRSEREVDNIGDCWNKYGWTFFEKPGGDGIWIRLLVCTVGQDLVYFGFWGRSENWEIRGSSRSWGWVRRLCSRVAGERKAEFRYFAFEKKKQSCLQVKCQKKWWVAVRKTLVEMYNYWTADTQFVTMTTSVAYTKLKIIIGINAWSDTHSFFQPSQSSPLSTGCQEITHTGLPLTDGTLMSPFPVISLGTSRWDHYLVISAVTVTDIRPVSVLRSLTVQLSVNRSECMQIHVQWNEMTVMTLPPSLHVVDSICCWLLSASAACQLSIDICYSRPRSAANQPHAAAAIDLQDRQTDGRTDTWPLHRPCFAYYAGSVNNII